MNKPLPGLANAKFCPRYTFLCVPRNVRFSKWQRVPDWHRQGVVVANAPDSVASQAANKSKFGCTSIGFIKQPLQLHYNIMQLSWMN